LGRDDATRHDLPDFDDRSSGILAHLTSLPNGASFGDLGSSATDFLRFLQRARQTWWQMLPVGPPGYGDSPYSAQSAFAGSPALVGLGALIDSGLLSEPRASHHPRGVGATLGQDAADRDKSLRAAFDAFGALSRPKRRGFRRFRDDNASWLDDYSLYRALKVAHGESSWTSWPAPLRDRKPRALAGARNDLTHELEYHAFVQFLFATQWSDLRRRARKAGVGLIGDMPLYVAHDSADVWAHPRLFSLDDAGAPKKIAGVPPDYFSATGQRWGNPLYAWEEHRKSEFRWWMERVKSALRRFDLVRLDHFIGYTRYWEIDAKAPTAADGKWLPGPGKHLFKVLRRSLSRDPKAPLPFIAEDLGAVGKDVLSLRDRFRLPGTKVLQFAFGNDPSAGSFLPHNYHHCSVVYTGTHDNDTTVGWYRATPEHDPRTAAQIAIEQRACRRYLGLADGTDIHWHFIRAASASVASLAITPLQDLLGLDSRSRMNRPGTTEGNWSWRAPRGSLDDALADRLAAVTATYERAQ
jgi:4-alpha-glucanotransferase